MMMSGCKTNALPLLQSYSEGSSHLPYNTSLNVQVSVGIVISFLGLIDWTEHILENHQPDPDFSSLFVVVEKSYL